MKALTLTLKALTLMDLTLMDLTLMALTLMYLDESLSNPARVATPAPQTTQTAPPTTQTAATASALGLPEEHQLQRVPTRPDKPSQS